MLGRLIGELLVYADVLLRCVDYQKASQEQNALISKYIFQEVFIMATITTKETRAFNWANPGTLKVGDEIVETLKDGREVVFVVMDDGVIGLKNLLGYHRMNEDWTNEGGWLACDMRRYLNKEVIALLPDELVAAIKPRKFGKEEDKLWLFSEMEVFGGHDWTENDPDRGFQFEYFKDRRNRIKVDEDGDAHWWWERSPNGGSSDHFCIVNSNGNAYGGNANYAGGVCFGFYI